MLNAKEVFDEMILSNLSIKSTTRNLMDFEKVTKKVKKKLKISQKDFLVCQKIA